MRTKIKQEESTDACRQEDILLTVSEFLDGVNICLRNNSFFVLGEVSEFKAHDKWVSFSLKDKNDNSVLRCFMSIWVYRKQGLLLENGMEIKVGGYSRVYKPAGTFSFNIDSIEPIGEGSLKKAYDLLMKKLEEEGLFARKREIPKYIKNIGVISSKSGVVIQDFLKNLKPLGFKISFYNSRVEGVDAVPQISDGIKYFNSRKIDVDVIVIMRGGGSFESMQAFNNENVCREIFSSKIPVICGIGHEVDVPIACLVADEYVSTPTAVTFRLNSGWTELAKEVWVLETGIITQFESALYRLETTYRSFFRESMLKFGHILSDIKRRSVGGSGRIFSGFKNIFIRFENLSERVIKRGIFSLGTGIKNAIDSVSRYERLLSLVDPQRNLRLGYSIVFDKDGGVVRGIGNMKQGDIIRIKFSDGEAESEVKSITN